MSNLKITPPVFAVKVGADIYEIKPTERGVNVKGGNGRSVFIPTSSINEIAGAINTAASLIPTLFASPVAGEQTETPAAPARAPRTASAPVKTRQNRATMQAARLRGEIPCLKGKDPFGVELSTLGIFGVEWTPGMVTSQDATGETETAEDEQDATDAPNGTTEF